MKLFVPRFKLGDIVIAEVIETLGSNTLIVRFDGDLIRVENQTKTLIRAGDRIQLVVISIQPLGFRLHSGRMPGRLGLQTRA